MTTKIWRAALQTGQLYKMLNERFPEFQTKKGRFKVAPFAQMLEMSPEGVFRWLIADRLTADGAKKIVAASEGRDNPVKAEDLIQFVLR